MVWSKLFVILKTPGDSCNLVSQLHLFPLEHLQRQMVFCQGNHLQDNYVTRIIVTTIIYRIIIVTRTIICRMMTSMSLATLANSVLSPSSIC